MGVQLAAGFVDSACKTMEYMQHGKDMNFAYDFVDLNVGCPLDDINNKRMGAGLMKLPYHLRTILRGMHSVSNGIPVTCKMRKGFYHKQSNAKELIDALCSDGVSAIGVHGRSRQQRYRRPADWDYIAECVDVSGGRVPIIGNGDVFNFNDWYQGMERTKCDTIMVGRGALIKPWLFDEIKQRRTKDMAASERLAMLRRFVDYGLERWGSDQRGVDNTRRFLLEWLSFLCRYIPVGILERTASIHETAPRGMYYVGRNELETLMASRNVKDWVRITEMLLGPVADSDFVFVPKHKASAYAPSAVDGKHFVLNELGEVVAVNDEAEIGGTMDAEPAPSVLTTTVLGQKRKLSET